MVQEYTTSTHGCGLAAFERRTSLFLFVFFFRAFCESIISLMQRFSSIGTPMQPSKAIRKRLEESPEFSLDTAFEEFEEMIEEYFDYLPSKVG